MALFADRIRLIDTENAFKIGPRIREVEAAGHRVIRCNIGEPDFSLPTHIRDEVKRQLDADNTHYSDPQGIPALREAIAGQLTATRNINISPDRVVVFPGAKPAIGFCQHAYTEIGDEVIYPSPGFPIYESFTRYVGATPVPLHLREENGFTLGRNELEELISERTKLIYLNFPSNPTGGVATPEQLAEIAEVILEKAPPDVRVYSDEVYEHILFDGAEHRSIASVPGMEAITIIVSGASKSYSWTGGRVGWAAFPSAAEAHEFRNLNINYFSCLPAYNQEGARHAINSPESLVCIREMAEAFQERRDFVVQALNEIDGITCQTPRGAFYVFPNVAGACERVGAIEAFNSLPPGTRERTSPSTLFQLFLLYTYHVATMDRRSFGRLGAEGKHYLRISIATALDDLREGMEHIAEATLDREGFGRFMREGRYRY
ncbi:MAG: pyridoxal phosphate-dependent aminotransferase [Thermoanaerobaculales bacterium]